MKTVNLLKYMAIAAVLFVFASCSKSTSGNKSSTATDAQTQSDDQTLYTNETDYASDDVSTALTANGGSYNQQRPESPSPICDAVITVDTTSNPRTFTITYNGTNCGIYNHTRTGTIVASFAPGFKWGDQGASLTITFNLTVQRISPAKTVKITGTRVITNATGGLLQNLASLDSVAYTITDNTSVTFDNGSQRSWQTSLRRTFTYNDGAVITTIGSLSGTNRFGSSFSADITEPLVVTQCSDFRYTSGQVTYTGALGGTSTTTFGLDASGSPTTGCQTGALYYKFVWIGPNNGTFTYNGVY